MTISNSLLNWSIDELIIDEDIDDDWICSICNKLMVENRQGCSDGHVFCYSCIISWLEKEKSCPVCRRPIPSIDCLSKNRYLEKEIKKITINCPFIYSLDRKEDLQNGCINVISIDTLEDHKSKCEFKFIECPYGKDRCELIRENKLLLHELICPFILIACEYCNFLLERGKMDDHIDTNCPSYDIKCDLCEEVMKRKNLIQHKEDNCPNVECHCIFEKGGCQEIFKRCEIEKHNHDWNFHLSVVKSLIEEVQKLKGSIEKLEIRKGEMFQYVKETNIRYRCYYEWVLAELSEEIEFRHNEIFSIKLSTFNYIENSIKKTKLLSKLTCNSNDKFDFKFSVSTETNRGTLEKGQDIEIILPSILSPMERILKLFKRIPIKVKCSKVTKTIS